MESTLRQHFAWAVSGRVGRLVFRLASTLLLMRWIDPEVFGRVAMALLAAETLFMLLDWGLGRSAVYQQELEDQEWRQLNGLHLALGLLAGGLIVSGWPLVEHFFKTELSDLLRWAFACRVAVMLWTVVPEARLERNALFKWMTQVELVTYALSVLPALLLAWYDYDEAALVVRELLPAAAMLAVLLLHEPSYARLSWGMDRLGKHFRFGLPITANGLLVFLSRRLDDLLIGRRFGDEALGVYGRAYALLTMPFMTLTRGFGRVMMPRIARDREQGRSGFEVYLTSVRSIAWLGYPAVVLAVILVKPFVDWWLGSAWALMVPLGRLFAALALLQLIGMLEDRVAQATGATQQQLRFMGPLKLLLTLSVVLAALLGTSVLMVAGVYAAASILYYALSIWWCCGLLGGRLSQVAGTVGSPFLAASIGAVPALALLYGGGLAGFSALLLPAILYVLVLLLVWRYLWPAAWNEILQPWIRQLTDYFL